MDETRKKESIMACAVTCPKHKPPALMCLAWVEKMGMVVVCPACLAIKPLPFILEKVKMEVESKGFEFASKIPPQ